MSTARFSSCTFTPDDPNSWRRLARNEKPTSDEYARTRMIGVKPTYVWDISQTTGDPVPELPRPSLLQGQAPVGLWDGLADQITAAGFELRLVSSAAAIGGANGLTDFLSREVSVRMDMDEAAQVKTLAHEAAHVLLHDPGDAAAGPCRDLLEVEAESVAFLVSAHHGLDTGDYTFAYIAGWAGRDNDAVRSTAGRVLTAGRTLLAATDPISVDDPTAVAQVADAAHVGAAVSLTTA